MIKIQLQVVCAILLCTLVSGKRMMSPEEMKKFNDTLDACKTQTNASPDDLKVLTNMQHPTTRAQYCLLACVDKKMGIMNQDNSFSTAKIMEMVEHIKEKDQGMYEKVSKVVADCMAAYVPQKDECDSVKALMDCKMKKLKEVGLDMD